MLTHPSSQDRASLGLVSFCRLSNSSARRALVASVTLAFAMFSVNSFAQAVRLGSGVTAQLVETSLGLFYQRTGSMEWSGNNNRPMVLLQRHADFIVLQDEKTLDQYTLRLDDGKINLLKATTTNVTTIGSITKVAEASGPGLNGVSFLLRSSDRMVQVDADRYFAPAGATFEKGAYTSDGTPGQWERKIYTALGATFSPTNGKTVNRVDLKDGSRFEKASGPLWAEYSREQFSWTDEWLRKPKAIFTEVNRDEWSVYLVTPGAKVQIDLYTKKVTWSVGAAKVVEILPEKFPYYGQFFRSNNDLMDDAAFKTKSDAISATLKTTNSSVTTINLFANTCNVSGAGYTSCNVLLGEFAPRGITGYSLGGFTLVGQFLDKKAKVYRFFDRGGAGGFFKILGRTREENENVWLMTTVKTRDSVQFEFGKKSSFLSLSEKSFPLFDGNTRQQLIEVQQYTAGQMKGFLPYPDPKLSPGFQIQNRTDHDVLVTLEQVGCLYYEVVKPGKIFYRNTGAVWFTVKAVIAPDLSPPNAFSCALSPALMIATVAAAGASGGTAAVPMAMLAGMVQGSAYATSSYVASEGGTKLGAIAAQTAVLVVGGGLAGGINGIVAMNNQMAPAVGKALAAGGVKAIVSVWNQEDLDKMTAQLTQEASLFGQYAGYDYPWKYVDRVMPIYEITGGPFVTQLQGGGVLYEYQKSPLKIRKIN
jgi:hypothetical protein